MTVQTLQYDEVVVGRPFTDIHNCDIDIQVMRFLCAGACLLVMETDMLAQEERPYVQYLPGAHGWVQRFIVTRPRRLAEPIATTAVGFFGRRRPDADMGLAAKLDRGLIPELSRIHEVLAYMTVKLPTDNFANVVLFESMAGKERWGTSKKHGEAVRLLTPDYYSSIRLYNGELPFGLADINALQLNVVKYLDYSEDPMWRAERILNREGAS